MKTRDPIGSKNGHVIYEFSLAKFCGVNNLIFFKCSFTNTIYSVLCMKRGSISLVVHADVWKLCAVSIENVVLINYRFISKPAY